MGMAFKHAILRQHTSPLDVLHDGIHSLYGILCATFILNGWIAFYIFGAFSLKCTRKSVNEACGNATEPIRAPHIVWQHTISSHKWSSRAQSNQMDNIMLASSSINYSYSINLVSSKIAKLDDVVPLFVQKFQSFSVRQEIFSLKLDFAILARSQKNSQETYWQVNCHRICL